MSEWWVHLQGDDADLAQLSVVLTSPDFAIQKKNGYYFLRSAHLNRLDDARKVYEAANAMLQPLNGLTRLMVRTSKFLTVGSLERFDDEGKTRYTMLTGSGIYAIQGSIVALGGNGTTRRAQQQDPLPALLSLSQTDEPVSRALRLYGMAVQPWKDLYPIYEILESNVGGEDALVSKEWTSRNQISRFTRTAGHPKVAGDEARHGVSTVEPPPNPMTPPEAWTFITSLLSQWLEFKQQSQRSP